MGNVDPAELREIMERIYDLARRPYSGVAGDIRFLAARALGIEAADHAAQMSKEWK